MTCSMAGNAARTLWMRSTTAGARPNFSGATVSLASGTVQLLHAGVEAFKQGQVTRRNRFGQLAGNALVISVRRPVAAGDGLHPAFAVGDQSEAECLANGIARSGNGGAALVLEVILHYIPGEFVGEFECLDQSLLFQPGQRPLTTEFHGFGQLPERPLVVAQALSPAKVGVTGHGWHLWLGGVDCTAWVCLTLSAKGSID